MPFVPSPDAIGVATKSDLSKSLAGG